MNDVRIIESDMTLMDALEYMDKIGKKLLVVCHDDKFEGVLSIGDIQRAVINKVELSDIVKNHIRAKIIYCTEEENLINVQNKMLKNRIESMPVIDKSGSLIRIISWEEVFDHETQAANYELDVPVVIMAGGVGSRLKPLTNILPKPLIPVSDKTIIEEIMDNFVKIGCNRFLITINYMKETIKEYFKNLKTEYNVEFIEEDKPLGTGGSLYLIRGEIDRTIIVTNCDALVNINYEDLLNYHKRNGNVATIVSVIKKLEIPYGTLETKEEGILVKLSEKPKFEFQINSGIYVFEPEVLDFIEDGEFIHMPNLLERLMQNKLQVGVFPISEKSWSDMGNWDEYLSMIHQR